MKKVILLTALAIAIFSLLPNNVFARSGCCSHHGGVCGCGCCDGTGLSDTCAPYYPQCSQPRYVAPIVTKAPVVYTPKPSTPKPTIRPTQTPTLIPTIKPTSTPIFQPEVKSLTTENENTPTPTVQPKTTETSSKDVGLGLGILASLAGGSIWVFKKIVNKFIK